MDEHKRLLVKEPTHPTEFEIQSFVYSKLILLGMNARGEVKAQFAGRQNVRFDIVVFKDGLLDMIIEIKKRKKNHKTCWEDTRQGSRYNQYGVPVVILYGMDDAVAFIEKMKSAA